jgi:spore germination cell wall hydrolase CwlJ-like protein
MVTRNRTKSNVYPTTYCGVVYQKCQFSWTLNKSNYVNTKSIVWKRIYNLATKIYTRKIIKDPSKGATHYYAHELIRSPIWARGVKPTIKLEAHTYLKLV